MADQQDMGSIPQPQPVYDVTFQHVYVPGQVFKQFYLFLWVAVAMIVGTVLPWRGLGEPQLPNLLQAILLVFAIGATWTGIASIKSRRLTLWPFLTLEIVAVICLLLQYRAVTDHRDQDLFTHQETATQIRKDLDDQDPRAIAIFDAFELARDNANWGVVDLITGHFDTMGGQVDPAVRAKHEGAWGSFGTGFYLTSLAVIFMVVFILGSVVVAVMKGKPKEDSKPVRRERSNRGKGDKSGKDAKAAPKDEAKA
ncbi:MAG: hypothetical protein V3W41_20080 [Planctomycetota bacterium]